MALWRNKGAPFPGPDGEPVPRGGTFEAEPSSYTVVIRRRKLQLLAGADVPQDWRPGYPGVDFASDRGYEIARDASPPLTPADFQGRTGTGVEGAFKADDVRAILAERDAQ